MKESHPLLKTLPTPTSGHVPSPPKRKPKLF